jgi:uncharacterized protein
MQLQWHPPDDMLFVRRCEAHQLVIVDRPIDDSFLLTPERVVEHWPVHDVRAISEADVDVILALGPEVVLIGSGARLVFPSQQIMAAFLTRGIGLETMDNAACARTFNVLSQEGRKVVAAFILPAHPA